MVVIQLHSHCWGGCLLIRYHNPNRSSSVDPCSYSSYSYSSVGNRPEDFNVFSQVLDQRLLFAGEHTLFDYHGAVHRAYLSGIAAVKHLTALVNID